MISLTGSQHWLMPALLTTLTLLLNVPASNAQTQLPPPVAPITIDASSPATAAAPADYNYVASEGRSPSGHILGLNSEYLTLDDKPWLPVMAEMHYSRVPESEWETEILKMKSAGVQIVSTYIIWIHHEEIEGQWEWTGQRDLRRFVQLCAKHHMYVVARIGPWSHAEVRNGGFPDWLLAKTSQTRSNDPTYLRYVQLYYQQIGQELKGLMWAQGGPVVAVQLENEYNRRGALGGSAHILKLKQLARDAGLRVPFYTVTGWDGAAIPPGEVLPVYGGYPDAPWDASIQALPPNEVYAFRFNSRVTGNMGAIGTAPTGNAANFTTDTPFMTAEMGGGMQVTYHRRPVVSADDIAAMMPVMLGSGVNLYGTYMFHGGENPNGKLTTLQESLATHYANDLPVKSYDFEAPIGEFGEERESLRKLKSWNYFLNDFGATLAPMQPHAPTAIPKDPADPSVVRLSARTSGNSGFLFVSNHVRGSEMPARENFQVTIKLPNNESLTVPQRPVTLPAGAYFTWPFNLNLSGLHLRYATAQPFAILGTPEAPVCALFAQPGIPAEFVIDDAPGLQVVLSQGSTGFKRENGALWFRGLQAGRRGDAISIKLPNGKRVTLLLLTQDTAEQSWKVAAGDRIALISTPQSTFVDGANITLQDLGSIRFSANLIPEDSARLVSADPQTKLQHSGADVTVSLSPRNLRNLHLTPEVIHAASEPAPLPTNFRPSAKPRSVAAAPTDSDWSRAGTWSIPLPKLAISPIPNKQDFLRIRYTGDVARLLAGGQLLTDNFYTGQPWVIGLDRFRSQITASQLQLSIYPLGNEPPIFFEPGTPTSPGAHLGSVELVTQYSLRLKLVPKDQH